MGWGERVRAPRAAGSKGAAAVVSAALAVLLAACGGAGTPQAAPPPVSAPAAPSTSSPAPTVDTATIDQAIATGAEGVMILGQRNSSGHADLIGRYMQARSRFESTSRLLSPTPSGVPDAQARRASEAMRGLADSAGAVLQCIERGASPEDCSSTTEQMFSDLRTAGEAVVGLAPYGTRSQQDLLALFDGI